jgi:hypothetical protein
MGEHGELKSRASQEYESKKRTFCDSQTSLSWLIQFDFALMVRGDFKGRPDGYSPGSTDSSCHTATGKPV